MTKESIRNWVKSERKKLNIDELSKQATKKIRTTNEYRHAQNIMIFYPLKEEINLLSLLKDEDKNFYLPKIEGKSLLCCPYKIGDKLCKSCFKTQEPLTEACDKNLIDLIIVPALACDKKNYRLGYGGGFYDRFLTDIKATKLSCIPERLFLETVYPDNHDIRMDKIIPI